jgi:hypothetical protein
MADSQFTQVLDGVKIILQTHTYIKVFLGVKTSLLNSASPLQVLFGAQISLGAICPSQNGPRYVTTELTFFVDADLGDCKEANVGKYTEARKANFCSP